MLEAKPVRNQPASGEEYQADVDGYAGLELFGQQAAHKAHSAVDEHINGVCHTELRAGPAKLAGKRQRKQAEKGRGGGEQALDPDACRFYDFCAETIGGKNS